MKFITPREQTALALMEAGELADYQAALSADPLNSFAAWKAGQLELKNRHYSEAVLHLKAASLMTPDHAPTFYLLSVAYTGTGETRLALEAAETARRLNPNNVGALLQKLRSLAGLKRWQEIENLQRLTPLSPPPNEVYLWSALAAHSLGNEDAARLIFAKVPPKTRRQYKKVILPLISLEEDENGSATKKSD